MNNYNLKWRIWAKIIAIIDLIFLSLQLLGWLLVTFIAGATTVAIVKDSETEKLPEGVEAVTWILWIAVAIMLIQTGVGIWAAVQLVKATELGRQAEEAYKLSRSWQIVCFVFILFSIISGCMAKTFIWTAVGALIRIIFMVVVFCFMREVQATIDANPSKRFQRV